MVNATFFEDCKTVAVKAILTIEFESSQNRYGQSIRLLDEVPMPKYKAAR